MINQKDYTDRFHKTAAPYRRCFFVGAVRPFASFFLLLFSFLFFSSCENSQKEIDTWTKPTVSVEEAKNIQTFLSQGGRLKAKLTAPLLKRYITDSQYVEFPKSLHVDFYNDSTVVVESQLNARYGKYYEFMNKVLLRDSVIVFNTKGDTMWTPELWWDQQKQEFYTDKPTVIRKIDGYYKGRKGFRAKQDLTDVLLFDLDNSWILSSESGFPQ
jgi:LPS export ABC transporter protein LptC